mgnify:CR=1 FL=1
MLLVFQANDDVTKCIVAIKSILYGGADQEPQAEVISQLSVEMYNVLEMLFTNLHRIDFEVCPPSVNLATSDRGVIDTTVFDTLVLP